MSGEPIIIEGADRIRGFRLLQLRAAMRLELIGLRHSRGSVTALVKREFSLKGNKQRVFEQFDALVTKETGVGSRKP